MKFSIVIPFYNDSKNIKTLMITLNDYLNDLDVEIVIVDDCSSAEDYEAIRKQLIKYQNVKISRNMKNSGPAQTRMNGVLLSSGDYIFFLDSDDGWAKNKAYLVYEYCISNDIVLSGSNAICIDKNKFENIRNIDYNFNNVSRINFIKSLWKNPYATSSVCVKREVILQHPFNENIRYSEDVECWRRILIDYDGAKFQSATYTFKHPYLSDTGLSSNIMKMSIGSTVVLASLFKKKEVKKRYKVLLFFVVIYSILKSAYRLLRKIMRK